MPEFFDSFRDSPKVPAGWRPRSQPGATVKFPLTNVDLRRFLQSILPGRWVKVYHYGEDRSQIHYCQHESGKVFDVKFKPARTR
jgi:hypothetical protein